MESVTTEAMLTDPSRRPWVAVAIIVAILAAHVVQSVWIFPTPRALLDNDHPVLVVDHALHLYHGALGSTFLREHGTTWGYDPFFMAGYPESPIWDSSSNLSILFQFLAGGGYHPRAYNLGLFFCSILVVAFFPLGTAAANFNVREIATATLLGWLYFHSQWADMLWRSGLFSFTTACAGTVLFIGLLLRYDRRPTWIVWGLLAFVGIALWFAHVTAPVLVLGAVVGFGVSTIRRHDWRWRLSIVAAGVCSLLANMLWIGPFLKFRGIRSVQIHFMAPDTAWHLINQYLNNDLDGPLSLFLLVTGMAGLIVWLIQGQFVRAATFGGAILVSLGLALFGGMWSVTATLEPLRFKASLNFLLAVPAGSVMTTSSAALARLLGGGRRGGLLVGAGWCLAVVAALVMLPEARNILRDRMLVKRSLVAGFRPEMQQLVRTLQEQTDSSARILFEDQLRLHELTDPESTHWTPLLPSMLGRDPRQFIGGLYHMAFITNHKNTSFGDFHLNGRPIDQYPPHELRKYADLYNVGWVVCWSPLSRFWFDNWAQAKRVATVPRYNSPNRPISTNEQQWRAMTSRVGLNLARQYMIEGEGQYNLYRIDRPRSFFLTGQGTIADVAWNRVEIADVVPSEGSVVLSLHWLDTFRTDPPLPVEPIIFPNDPVPFVRILTPQPQKRIVLYNGYGR